MSWSQYKYHDSEKVTLESSDGQKFEVEETVALESLTIKHALDMDWSDKVIRLPNVTGIILSKVIEYCKRHVEARAEDKKDDKSTEDELKAWDLDFVKVDQETLFNLILVANYLNIKSLLDLTCQTVADMIMERTPEENRRVFNLNNALTPEEEEEEEVRRGNQGAFE